MNTDKLAPASISDEIQSVILTKNPISLFFGLSRLRTLFEDLADSLLSNIEKTYYIENTASFIDLIKEYEDLGFYDVIGAYQRGSDHYELQKRRLDAYFEQSYWRDVDFYFFVLDRHPEIHAKIELLLHICENHLEGTYTMEETEEGKAGFLEELAKQVGVSVRDFSHMPAFNAFFDSLVPLLGEFRETGWYKGSASRGWKISGQKFIKELYLYSFSCDRENVVRFWRTYFLEDAAINRNLLELLNERQIQECLKYLREKLLRVNKYNLAVSDSSVYQKSIRECIQLENQSIDRKLAFLSRLHVDMGTSAAYREQFQNVLRRGLLYQNSIDLIDSILGISFLKRSVFYEIRKRTVGIDNQKYLFESLDEVKVLVKLLESSVILRFFRPFFILRLSQVFNKWTELYYFIKFVLTVHSSATYNEYQELSRFFLSLEAFGKKGWYGKLLKLVQFGWVILAVMFLAVIAPFWVFAAITGYMIVRGIRRLVKSKFPDLVLASNFQLGSFLALVGIASLTLGATIWLRDNTKIVYENFKPAINAATLVTSETIRLMDVSLLKASLFETGPEQGSEESIFSRIDYLQGTDYQSLSDKR